jgi:hypothetical protein
MTMKVGVIGLGAMGSGLAESLLRAGHQVVVWNRSKAPLEPLRIKGAHVADAPADAFAVACRGHHTRQRRTVRRVILDGGLLEHADGGTVHVMSATISVALAKELEEVHAKERVALVCARCWTPRRGREGRAERAGRQPRRRSPKSGRAGGHRSQDLDAGRAAHRPT